MRQIPHQSMRRFSATPLACCAIMLFLLSGCGKMFDTSPAPSEYLLSADTGQALGKPALPLQLMVERPEAGGDLATDRIAVLVEGSEVRYVEFSNWTTPVPITIQRLMIESLEKSGGFAGVGDGKSGLTTQAQLSSNLKRFYLRHNGKGPSWIEVSLSVRLIDIVQGTVIGSAQFDAKEETPSESMHDVTASFNKALTGILARNTAWVYDTMAEKKR